MSNDEQFKPPNKPEEAEERVRMKTPPRTDDDDELSERGRHLSSTSDSSVKHKAKRSKQVSSNQPLAPARAKQSEASSSVAVSHDDIVNCVETAEKIALVHELALNQDFKLQTATSEPNSVESQVKEVMQKAFWDSLREKIAKDPPDFSHAVVLLGEIKQLLENLLLSHNEKTREMLNRELDAEVIKKQAHRGVIDLRHYASVILDFAKRICAPIRDDEIKKLQEGHDLLLTFQGIYKLVHNMALDMANFEIKLLQPKIKESPGELESKLFDELLEKQADGLKNTRLWYKASAQQLLYLCETKPQMKQIFKGANGWKISLTKILTNAYLRILQWEGDVDDFPETLKLDFIRYMSIRDRIKFMSIEAAILSVIFNHAALSSRLASSGLRTTTSALAFKKKIKREIDVLLTSKENCDQYRYE